MYEIRRRGCGERPMTLKTCTCGQPQTTKTAKLVARCDGLGMDTLYFNCKKCGSTFCIVSQADQEKIRKEQEAKCRAA